jgi:hypothetical protein
MATKSVANPVAHLTEEDWAAMDDKTYCENMDKVINAAPPLLSFEDMDKLERWWRDGVRRRRCSLILLTTPAKELVEKVQKDRGFAVAVADVLDGIKDLTNVAQELTELFNAVEARTILALAAREDMQEIMDEATAAGA